MPVPVPVPVQFARALAAAFSPLFFCFGRPFFVLMTDAATHASRALLVHTPGLFGCMDLAAGPSKCRKWHIQPTTPAPATAVFGPAGGLTCRSRKEGSKGLSNFKGGILQRLSAARSLNAITRSCNKRYKGDGAFAYTANAQSKDGEEGFLSFRGTLRDCKQLTKALQKGIKQFNSGVAKTKVAKFLCKATAKDDVFHVYHKASGRCATEAK